MSNRNKRTFCVSITTLFYSLFPSAPIAIALESIQKIEGAVNSDVILTSDIDRFKKTAPLRAQIDPLFANTTLARRINEASKAEITDFLTEELLILQSFPVSDSEVDQEISSIQSNNGINREELKAALASQGFSFDDYYELIRVGTSKRNLIDREIRSRTVISDEDIKNYYYQNHSKNALIPNLYKIRIFSFKSREAADSFTRQIKKNSGSGLDNTSDPVETDYLNENEIQPMFKKVLSTLSPGEVSTVIHDSGSDFYAVQLVDKRAGIDIEFEKTKEDIRSKLSAVEFQRQISLWIEKQRSQSFVYKARQ